MLDEPGRRMHHIYSTLTNVNFDKNRFLELILENGRIHLEAMKLLDNWGGSWLYQRREFAEFPGVILGTSNCVQ